MFGAVAVAYGVVWARAMVRLESGRLAKKTRHQTTKGATMTLSNPRGHEI